MPERLSQSCSFTITSGLRKSQSFLAFSNRAPKQYHDNHSKKNVTYHAFQPTRLINNKIRVG